jgi:hypothetical protein
MWLSWEKAIETIRRRLGASIGRAEATLIKALGSEEVRKCGSKDSPIGANKIFRTERTKLDRFVVRVRTDAVIPGTPGPFELIRVVEKHDIEIDGDDLADWLDRQDLEIATAGAPGRPTSMYLVEREHARRIKNGEAAMGIKAEAEILAKWLKTAHPQAPRVTSQTIRNKISKAHREAGLVSGNSPARN